jgi:glycosyltransferase involved in cell wall biosynthesis
MANEESILNLSIIIPCYNVENYIEQCLNSIVQQAVLPKEIICIDDGATDDTAVIIQAFAEKFSCVKYLYQTNQGVSQARNAGINQATGQYIQFVDPDDILHPNLFATFLNIFNIDGAIELFYFENQRFEELENLEFNNNDNNLIKFSSGNELFAYLIEKERYPAACWKYIFKKKMLNVRFEGRNHEDHLITLNILLSANLSYYTKAPLYYYRKRSNSLTSNKKISKQYVELFAQVIDKCTKYVQKSNLLTKTKTQYINFLRSDYLFNINIYYLYKEKPPIIEMYMHIYTRLFIKNNAKKLSNILYIIRYGIRNKIPLKHIMIFIKASLNKDINFITNKINGLLN